MYKNNCLLQFSKKYKNSKKVELVTDFAIEAIYLVKFSLNICSKAVDVSVKSFDFWVFGFCAVSTVVLNKSIPR